MIDQEVLDGQINADRFPFPSEGDITLAVRNANYTLGRPQFHDWPKLLLERLGGLNRVHPMRYGGGLMLPFRQPGCFMN